LKAKTFDIPGVVLIEPDVHRDERGYFLQTYHQEQYAPVGLSRLFVQDNQSSSTKGTLRGLHAQLNRPQGKLIRVLKGTVFDVAVDARPDSPGFGRWVSAELSSENFLQLYVPPGLFHGFCVTSEEAVVSYKCTDFYDPRDEVGVAWNDPELQIAWPVKNPVLSKRDSGYGGFSEIRARLEAYRGLK